MNVCRDHRRQPVTWFIAPAILVGSWMLSGYRSSTTIADLEQRVASLEAMLRKGPGGSLQVSGPFEVVGSDGTAILRVATVATGTGGVVIWRSAQGAGVDIASQVARPLATLERQGEEVRLLLHDPSGKPRSAVTATQVLVYDNDANGVAVLGQSEGRGFMGIKQADHWIGTLQADPEFREAGLLRLRGPGEKVVAEIGAGGSSHLAGVIRVMNEAGKAVAGMSGAQPDGGLVLVTNSTGTGVAQLSTMGGRGLVQVFRRDGKPAALLTEAPDRPGGLLQVSGPGGPMSALTVGEDGSGYLQLISPTGATVVEAGTLPNGKGTVRVGPKFSCSPVKAATPGIDVGFTDCIVGQLK